MKNMKSSTQGLMDAWMASGGAIAAPVTQSSHATSSADSEIVSHAGSGSTVWGCVEPALNAGARSVGHPYTQCMDEEMNAAAYSHGPGCFSRDSTIHSAAGSMGYNKYC